jgi:SAM-dependent methyltransferase
MTDRSITELVRQQYAAVAQSTISQQTAGVMAVARAFGYSAEELMQLPAEANMGLGCGNPTALANLKPGEVVVDLGCGGGIDVLLAARKVGPTGKAIGIDMTPEMLARARRSAEQCGLTHVEFYQATLDALPLPDASVDCIISNCVINLVPDKNAAFREMYRVLVPGGRLALSDIALKRPLPEELARSVAAHIGCIAGALSFEAYEHGLRQAGFADVLLVDAQVDLNAYAQIEGQSACCSPAMESALCCSPARESTINSPAVDTVSLPVSEGSLLSPVNAAGKSACAPGTSSSCCESPPSSTSAGRNAPSSPNPVHAALADLLRRYNLNDYAASVRIYAVKPKDR